MHPWKSWVSEASQGSKTNHCGSKEHLPSKPSNYQASPSFDSFFAKNRRFDEFPLFSVRLIGIMAFLLLLLNSFLVGQRCSCFDDLSFSWCEFFLFWSLASYLDHGMCYPEGCAAPGSVPCQCNTRGLLSKLEETPPQTKINVTSKSPVGDISVVTLIRTDTTLDHSQKAEKVWSVCCQRQKSKMMQNIHDAFGQRPVQLLPRIAQERTWMIVRWAAKQRHRRSE